MRPASFSHPDSLFDLKHNAFREAPRLRIAEFRSVR
jgi:hypothetical protein